MWPNDDQTIYSFGDLFPLFLFVPKALTFLTSCFFMYQSILIVPPSRCKGNKKKSSYSSSFSIYAGLYLSEELKTLTINAAISNIKIQDVECFKDVQIYSNSMGISQLSWWKAAKYFSTPNFIDFVVVAHNDSSQLWMIVWLVYKTKEWKEWRKTVQLHFYK